MSIGKCKKAFLFFAVFLTLTRPAPRHGIPRPRSGHGARCPAGPGRARSSPPSPRKRQEKNRPAKRRAAFFYLSCAPFQPAGQEKRHAKNSEVNSTRAHIRAYCLRCCHIPHPLNNCARYNKGNNTRYYCGMFHYSTGGNVQQIRRWRCNSRGGCCYTRGWLYSNDQNS